VTRYEDPCIITCSISGAVANREAIGPWEKFTLVPG